MKRKINLIRHPLGHNWFIGIIMERKINDKITKGTLRNSFFDETF